MKSQASHNQLTVYTVGHSTHSLDDFVSLLRAYGIERLVDVRTIPRSRHNPQFNYDTLGTFLRNRRIGYRHMKELGGLRHARADSPNIGWHNASFRGFADYMQTPEFDAAVVKLIELAREKTTAIMCAEAVPWRCHRSLIGDALIVRGGISVVDIYTPKSAKLHAITPMAKVHGTRVTYPAPAGGNGTTAGSNLNARLSTQQRRIPMKYMISWFERPQGSPTEYENAQKRILEVFTQWKAPANFKIELFVVRVGEWGGHMLVDCDDPVAVHKVCSTWPAFEFQARPVIAVEDAVRVELEAIAWRDELKRK